MDWVAADGKPLRFAYGQAVKINWGSPTPVVRDQINSGWIVGFDCVSGAEPAYLVHRMGRTLTVRESGLSACNDGDVPFAHAGHVVSGGTCSICGLRVCEMCNETLRHDQEYFCSDACGRAYVKSWE